MRTIDLNLAMKFVTEQNVSDSEVKEFVDGLQKTIELAITYYIGIKPDTIYDVNTNKIKINLKLDSDALKDYQERLKRQTE